MEKGSVALVMMRCLIESCGGLTAFWGYWCGVKVACGLLMFRRVALT